MLHFPFEGSVAGEVIGILWQAISYKFCKRSSRGRKIVNFLDGAKISKGGKFLDLEVDHLKYVIKTIPIFLTLIMFSTFTSQVKSSFILPFLYENFQCPLSVRTMLRIQI